MGLFFREDGLEEPTSVGGLGVAQALSRSRVVVGDTGIANRASVRLEDLIAGSVIPAIAVTHLRAAGTGSAGVHAGSQRWRPSPQGTEDFAQAVLRGNLPEAKALIDGFVARGMRIEQLFLDVLEPAARMYGDGWASDDCDFTEVTVGCWRLQQIMHDYAAEFHREVALAGNHSARIWLSAVPGEQHTFGVGMLREFFVRAGHEVIGMPVASGSMILETVRREHLDVFGLSVAGEVTCKVLGGLIEGVRAVSRNRSVRILIGGPALIENPELCTKLGADGWARGAQEALRVVDTWCTAPAASDAH